MRKATERQGRLDCPAVVNVKLNLACRDEIIPILMALQHVYERPELRDEILRAVAADVNGRSSRKRGRQGMDYWSIVVLAAVRLGCNLNYDKLQDLAEQHRALRQVMGIGDWEESTPFDWRRIRDNITLIRPQTLERINHLIVGEGHRLVPEAVQTARADSFVMGTNIHYPTESSLIRDGLRKVLECGGALAELLGIESAINALQSGNGLERCRDRTEVGFSRYIQLGALGRNLHVLGKILLAREDAGCQAAQSRRNRAAA